MWAVFSPGCDVTAAAQAAPQLRPKFAKEDMRAEIEQRTRFFMRLEVEEGDCLQPTGHNSHSVLFRAQQIRPRPVNDLWQCDCALIQAVAQVSDQRIRAHAAVDPKASAVFA